MLRARKSRKCRSKLPFHLASEEAETEELLLAAFTDFIDFKFFPVPKPFVLSADHDEYTSFFAISKSNLNRVVLRLESVVEYVPEQA